MKEQRKQRKNKSCSLINYKFPLTKTVSTRTYPDANIVLKDQRFQMRNTDVFSVTQLKVKEFKYSEIIDEELNKILVQKRMKVCRKRNLRRNKEIFGNMQNKRMRLLPK